MKIVVAPTREAKIAQSLEKLVPPLKLVIAVLVLVLSKSGTS